MGKSFNLRLTSKNLDKIAQELKKYKENELLAKMNLFVERLAEVGVQSAKANLVSLDAVFTGELLNSIKSVPGTAGNNQSVFFVVVHSDYCAFVEFGTGSRGKQLTYMQATGDDFPDGVRWRYNKGKTIRVLADGRIGWFYPANDGGWYFTEGMPSRPYMYMAGLDIRDRVLKVAKEIWG